MNLEVLWLWWGLMVVAILVAIGSYFSLRTRLKDAIMALREIRGLVLYGTKGIEDRRFSQAERDEIIGRVLAITKGFS